MGAVYAEPVDVVNRWRALTPAEETKATAMLSDASAILRIPVPNLDDLIAADPAGDLVIAAKVAVVNAVIRVLSNPDGAKRLQETIGDRAYTLDFGDVPTSGLFISADELGPLLPSKGTGQGHRLGTAIVGTRAGWAPCGDVPPYGNAAGWPVG